MRGACKATNSSRKRSAASSTANVTSPPAPRPTSARPASTPATQDLLPQAQRELQYEVAWSRCSHHAGRSSVNVVSPGRESTDRRPAMRSASSLAMANPSPDPWASSAV
jgi:hypothetical protein